MKKDNERELEKRVRQAVIREAKNEKSISKRNRLRHSAYYLTGIYAKCAAEYLNDGDMTTAQRYGKQYQIAEEINGRMRKRIEESRAVTQ